MNNTYQPNAATIRYGWMIVLCLILLIIASCKKNFLPNLAGDDKIVILSEAIAGDLVRIPIGKTIRAGGGNLVKFEKVSDATVVLQEESGSKWILKADKSPQFANNPASIFYTRQHFKPNTQYTIEVMHPVLGNAKAGTRIPPPVALIALDTLTTYRQGKPVLTVSITLQDSLNYPEAYIIEAVKQLVSIKRYFFYDNKKQDYDTPEGAQLYERVKNEPGVQLLRDSIPRQQFVRLNLFCMDANIDNMRFDNPDKPLRRIFLPDHSFDGRAYKLKFSIEKDFFTGNTPEEKGRVLLQLKSASRELYKYLLTYEKYKSDFGTIPANQLTSPAGNVQGGLGVFGGATQLESVWYMEELR